MSNPSDGKLIFIKTISILIKPVLTGKKKSFIGKFVSSENRQSLHYESSIKKIKETF
jgi:hypothetical protein